MMEPASRSPSRRQLFKEETASHRRDPLVRLNCRGATVDVLRAAIPPSSVLDKLVTCHAHDGGAAPPPFVNVSGSAMHRIVDYLRDAQLPKKLSDAHLAALQQDAKVLELDNLVAATRLEKCRRAIDRQPGILLNYYKYADRLYASEADPNCPFNVLSQAADRGRGHDISRVKEHYARAHAAHPENPWLLFAAGLLVFTGDAQRSAVATLRREHPTFAGSHLLQGILLVSESGQQEAARAALSQALQCLPALGEAHFYLGCLLARQPGQGDAALAALNAAIELLPERSEAYYVRAGLRRGTDPAAALGDAEQAYRIEPCISVLTLQAEILFDMTCGDPEKCAEVLRLLQQVSEYRPLTTKEHDIWRSLRATPWL